MPVIAWACPLPNSFTAMPPAALSTTSALQREPTRTALKNRADLQTVHTDTCALTHHSYVILTANIAGAMTLVFDLTEIKSNRRPLSSSATRLPILQAMPAPLPTAYLPPQSSFLLSGNRASRGADQQTQRVSETATAMEQMNVSCWAAAMLAVHPTPHPMLNKAEHGADVVNKVVQGINQLHTQALALKSGMASLGDQAQSIGQIMTVISDIADRDQPAGPERRH